MHATQRVAEVTWTGNGGGEGKGGGLRGRRRAERNCFSYFIKSVVHFSKPGSVRTAVAASIVVHRSR